jgi:hypothetical protein
LGVAETAGGVVVAVGASVKAMAGCVSVITIIMRVGDSLRLMVWVVAGLGPAGGGSASELSDRVPAGANRRVANHPPKNRAVTDSQMKIEIRARWARTVSSSLTIGKIALCASRLERKATRIAITVAPILKAAKISKMVGKDGITQVTPRF